MTTTRTRTLDDLISGAHSYSTITQAIEDAGGELSFGWAAIADGRRAYVTGGPVENGEQLHRVRIESKRDVRPPRRRLSLCPDCRVNDAVRGGPCASCA